MNFYKVTIIGKFIWNCNVNFKQKYIGTPMLHYCPMTKLEKRLEELEIILDGVSN